MKNMKQFFFFLCIMIIIGGTLQAQTKKRGYEGKHSRANEKIEELEKVKLIETLDLDEDTMLKFFSRRKDHRNKINELRAQRDEKLNLLQKMLVNEEKGNYKDLVTSLIETEEKIDKQKTNYYHSLNDILSYDQIAKLMVFERNFRRELRDTIMKYRSKEKAQN